MATPKPSYYGILPAEVRYDKTLSPMARIMFAEITALASSTGECTASSNYFAKLYEVQRSTVSEWISQLVNAGYVLSFVDHDNGNRRTMRIPSLKNQTPLSEKADNPLSEKADNNNTSNNISTLRPTVEKIYRLYLKRFKIQQFLEDGLEEGAALDRAATRYRLTDNRVAAIMKILNHKSFEGDHERAAKMLAAAIVGYSKADWANGERNGWTADLQKFICRSYEDVERGANLYEESKTRRTTNSDSWHGLK